MKNPEQILQFITKRISALHNCEKSDFAKGLSGRDLSILIATSSVVISHLVDVSEFILEDEAKKGK